MNLSEYKKHRKQSGVSQSKHIKDVLMFDCIMVQFVVKIRQNTKNGFSFKCVANKLFNQFVHINFVLHVLMNVH